MARRDWCAIKAAYVAGTPAPELAARHGVPLSTLESRASRERWSRDRKMVADQVQAELPGRVAEVVLDAAAQMIERHFTAFGRGLSAAERMFDDVEPVINPETGEPAFHEAEDGRMVPVVQRTVQRPNQLRDVLTAIEKAVNGQRQARGLADPKHDPHGGTKGDQATGVIELPMLGPEPVPPDDDPGDQH